MKDGRLQPKDLPTLELLNVIRGINFSCRLKDGPTWGERLFTSPHGGRSAPTQEIYDLLPAYPPKLIQRKLEHLERKWMVQRTSAHGWKLHTRGREMLDLVQIKYEYWGNEAMQKMHWFDRR